MRKKLYLLGLLVIAVACGPKNEEVRDEQVEVTPPAEALDSIANTQLDGLQTDENDIDPTMPMPQPVMQLLSEQYANWEKPTLTEEALEQSADYLQAPMIVRGDFDGDTRQDLALQLQQGNDLVIVAALQEQEGAYELYELKRDILFNERGTLRSPYYLYLIEQGEPLHMDTESEEAKAEHDAVALGIEGEDVVYLFEGGTFTSYGISN